MPVILMLKILSILSKNQQNEATNKVKNKIRDQNRNNNNIYLFKSKNLAQSKNLFKFNSIKTIKNLTF